MSINIKASTRRVIALGTIVIGWILCGYLAYRTSQISGDPSPSFDLCKTIFGASCDEALSHSASWQLGFPLTGWGLVYFGLLGLLLATNKPAVDRAAIILAAFGTGVSIVLSHMSISMEISCVLCLAVHIINLLTLVSIVLAVRPYIKNGEQQGGLFLKHSISWGILVVLVIIAGGATDIYIMVNSIGNRTEASLSQSYEDFQKGAAQKIPKNDITPLAVSIDAPLQLVVFSSFQCPGCEQFSQTLHKLSEIFNENLSIEFKNYPLSSSCNPALNVDMQPRSCNAALAAIAANNQNRFWEYHDLLFQSNMQADENTLLSIANNIGLNIEKWETDRHSEEAMEQLSEDIEFGNKIGIHATPTVFLNGRQVKNFNEASLAFLLHQELNHLSK